MQAVAFESDDPALAGTMTITWRMTDVPVGVDAADHAPGLRPTLANLAVLVER